MTVLLGKNVDESYFMSYILPRINTKNTGVVKMTQRKKLNNTTRKLRDIDWETVITSTVIAVGILLMVGATTWGELDRKRALYTPGESLPKKERAAVDSLHDPLVEHIKTLYSKYYRDYMRLLPTISSRHDWYTKPLPAGHCLPTCRGQIPTMNEYLYFLKDFEQKAVEKYYRETNEKLKKQKQLQKQK